MPYNMNMEFKDRLSGLNALEWFLIAFSFIMVGAAGYALGSQATVYNNEPAVQKRYLHNKRLLQEQDQSSQPLQAPPTDLQGGSRQTQQRDVTNPQGSPPAPGDDLLYPYDPPPCGPYRQTTDMQCLD
jgi:hypothetical protein